MVGRRSLIDRLDRNELGPQHAELVAQIYSRVDDLLAMLYDDIYGLDGSGVQIPQPPSA
jgi:hypothetical protein